MVVGLDDWQVGYASEVSEERLLSSEQKAQRPGSALADPANKLA
jgi:hypothetical protein